MIEGEVKYYEHPPGMRGAPGIYPPDYRQQQILKREVELHEMLTSILDGSAASLPPGLFSLSLSLSLFSNSKKKRKKKVVL